MNRDRGILKCVSRLKLIPNFLSNHFVSRSRHTNRIAKLDIQQVWYVKKRHSINSLYWIIGIHTYQNILVGILRPFHLLSCNVIMTHFLQIKYNVKAFTFHVNNKNTIRFF